MRVATLGLWGMAGALVATSSFVALGIASDSGMQVATPQVTIESVSESEAPYAFGSSRSIEVSMFVREALGQDDQNRLATGERAGAFEAEARRSLEAAAASFDVSRQTAPIDEIAAGEVLFEESEQRDIAFASDAGSASTAPGNDGPAADAGGAPVGMFQTASVPPVPTVSPRRSDATASTQRREQRAVRLVSTQAPKPERTTRRIITLPLPPSLGAFR